MTFSFHKSFFAVALVIALTVVMYFGKGILVPLSFSFLIAFILYPIVRFLISKGVNRMLAIIITLLLVLFLISGILYLFSAQIVNIAGEYTNFVEKLQQTFDASITFLNERISIIPDVNGDQVLENLKDIFADSSFLIISDTVSFTSSFVSYFLLSLIYTFLILFYSRHLKAAMMTFSTPENREQFATMLKEVHHVGKQYFTGTVVLMLVLGILNSTGLLILGLDYPFFFGFLAAILAIIPYVGTTLGGLIPTLYAFVTYESLLYPLAVIGLFWFIQFLEGNFLNPRIVGGKLRINALFSILSLIAGGFLWGLSGMILFLPFVAILKVICSHYDELKPIAAVLGDTIPEELQKQDDQKDSSRDIIKRLVRTVRSKVS